MAPSFPPNNHILLRKLADVPPQDKLGADSAPTPAEIFQYQQADDIALIDVSPIVHPPPTLNVREPTSTTSTQPINKSTDAALETRLLTPAEPPNDPNPVDVELAAIQIGQRPNAGE